MMRSKIQDRIHNLKSDPRSDASIYWLDCNSFFHEKRLGLISSAQRHPAADFIGFLLDWANFSSSPSMFHLLRLPIFKSAENAHYSNGKYVTTIRRPFYSIYAFWRKGTSRAKRTKTEYEVKIEIEISAKNSFTNLEFRNSKLKKLKV